LIYKLILYDETTVITVFKHVSVYKIWLGKYLYKTLLLRNIDKKKNNRRNEHELY